MLPPLSADGCPLRRSGGADAPASSCQAQERMHSLAAWLMKMFVFLRHEEKLGSADTQLEYHTQDGVGNGIVGGICRQIHLHTAAGASPRPTLGGHFAKLSHLLTCRIGKLYEDAINNIQKCGCRGFNPLPGAWGWNPHEGTSQQICRGTEKRHHSTMSKPPARLRAKNPPTQTCRGTGL